MKRNQFIRFVRVISSVLLLALVSCMPSPTPTLTPPTETAIPSTPAPQGRTLLVTSPADSGPGTLRQAMEEAQPHDTITFDPAIFPPDAPVTIFIASALPQITQGNLTIDASNAGVILDGSNATGDWLAGLEIVSSNANIIRGLQITKFSGPGIAIAGDAQYNTIGGDRSIGSGPFGQGNMLTLNDNGIVLSTPDTSLNTITGNLIGTDAEGADTLGNRLGVGITEGAYRNTIGPNNIIAYNDEFSIQVEFSESLGNTITQNSIHDNGEPSIFLVEGGNMQLVAPTILNFDLTDGFVTGFSCANCAVEIFSDGDDEGAIYEGWIVADGNGKFNFMKGAPLAGPSLTATATDPDGNTTAFSPPTQGNRRSLSLQVSNVLPLLRLQTKPSNELADNRMSTQLEAKRIGRESYDQFLAVVTGLGVKRIRLSFNEFEMPFDLTTTELSIHPADDAWVDSMISNGIALTYVMTFWDKEYQIGGGELGCPRFRDESEIQRYLEYVKFVVQHFKGRIEYFEIWNEPNDTPCPQGIEVAEHIELVRRMVPVVRQENSEAKIVVGAVTWLHEPVSQDYLFALLSSDIMPVVDGISWHPFYGASPQYPYGAEYYITYSSLLQKIKEVASTAGFTGEYRADELTWRTPLSAHRDHPWIYSEITAAKYYARSIVLHLGMDIIASPMVDERLRAIYSTVSNLSTVMAGNKPLEISVEIETDATNLMSYGFSLPNGDRLFAVWTDGVAVDDDPGVPATLTFPGTSAKKVIGIDVLHGFEQELIIETENGNLVIQDLLVKDYPIILRLID